MALQIPCTGQELISKINNMEESDIETKRVQNARLNSLETDGFHVGDIRHSHRTGLGDNYLLCNGDHVLGSEGYSDLIGVMQNNGAQWWWDKTTNKSDKNEKCWFSNKTSIYCFEVVSGSLYVTRYKTYNDLLNNSGVVSAAIPINISSITASSISVLKFNDKIFLKLRVKDDDRSYRSKIYSTDLNNLESDDWFNSPDWDVVNECSSDCAMACNEDRLIIAYLARYYSDSGNLDTSRLNIICFMTTNGIDFDKTKYKTQGWSGLYMDSLRNGTYNIHSFGETFYIQFDNMSSIDYKKYITFYNENQTFSDWVFTSHGASYPNTAIVRSVYHDNYYWCECKSGSLRKVYRTATFTDYINGNRDDTGISINISYNETNSIDYSSTLLGVINGEMFFAAISSVYIYDPSIKMLVKTEYKDIKKYLIPDNCYKYNQLSENDEICIFSAYPVNTIGNMSEYLCMVFKNNTYLLLSTIPYDKELGYTYIKAKG